MGDVIMMTPEERAAFGWIGAPPAEITECSIELTNRWKQLAADAREVAAMRFSPRKLIKAREIAQRRQDLVEMIERQARNLRNGTTPRD